jgi:hypothetical protein
MVELLALAAEPASPSSPYARIQFLVPKISISPENELRLSPVLDMLSVRYVVFRIPPFQGARPVFQGSDYWVMANPAALPRVFIPERTELAADKGMRLNKLGSEQFDPRLVAYVESPVNLPEQCRGTAEIVEEIPTRVTISAHMETPGLIVLADRWDQGWKASLNGQPVPILRTNHPIRGIVVPAGSLKVQFYYAPGSFTLGLRLFGLATGLLIIWSALILRRGNLQRNQSTIPF